ncbi:hypothetical protein NZK32_09450 [Cyanobium sp. FGCU-52]|nr:hypothetical protein [Cyanobium sp. FGCU52]
MSLSPAHPPQAPELPDGAALLALERQVRRSGSGLAGDQLAGVWRLQQVWPRSGSRPTGFAAALLRGLAATLEIRPAADRLALVNSVRLGPLELRFEGEGVLEGRRPLLVFGFERCRLRAGERDLFSRSLPAPDPRRRPFFALIGSGSTPVGSAWLAARGRGGGLALWCRDASEG